MSSCDVCARPSTKRCSCCKARNYCSRFCQSEDWKSHADECCLPPPAGRVLCVCVCVCVCNLFYAGSAAIAFPPKTAVNIVPGTPFKFIFGDYDADYDLSVQSPVEAVQQIAKTLFDALDFSTDDVCRIATEFVLHESSVWKIAQELHRRWRMGHPYISVTSVPADLQSMPKPFCTRVFVEPPVQFHKKAHRTKLTCCEDFVSADTNNYVYVSAEGTRVNIRSTKPYPKSVLDRVLKVDCAVLSVDWYHKLYAVLKRFMTKRVLMDVCVKIALKANAQLTQAKAHLDVGIVFVHEGVTWKMDKRTKHDVVIVDAKSFAGEYERVVAGQEK